MSAIVAGATSVEMPVLIVDDDPLLLNQMKWLLQDEFPLVLASTYEEGLALFYKRKPTVAIVDLCLAGSEEASHNGISLLEKFMASVPDFQGVVLTGSTNPKKALEAIRSGAFDYLKKPFQPEELKLVLRRARHRATLLIENTIVKENDDSDDILSQFPHIITQSDAVRSVLRTVIRAAPTNVSILVTGESGTGKELVARACHEISERRSRPFIPINCGAIPQNLLESELFGHEKGSFTGASESRPGKFELAEGGTIFLDEVAELPTELQVKLLRFLQDKVVERVGGRTSRQLDVRIIAATNRDLVFQMANKQFREDLFYRLSVVKVELPPLRDRGDDLQLLATRFLKKFAPIYQKNRLVDFSRESWKLLKGYNWPGNVRELENRIQRAVIMSTGKWVQPDDLDLARTGLPERKDSNEGLLHEVRGNAEKKMLVEVLRRANGNISMVAREIGVSRPTVHALIKKFGLSVQSFRA